MGRHDAIETSDVGGLTIEIYHDEDCSSPRENDNLGTIATWHRRYDLGDVQPRMDPDEYLKTLPKGSIVLPVYMYEHSGIALSTGRGYPFDDPWDSGQLGFIHVSPAKIRECYMRKRITKRIREQAIACLQAEIEEYSRYVGGECYGYVITDPDGETIDSCWGFIGFEYVQEQAKQAAEYALTQRHARQAEDREMYDDG